MLVNNYTSYDIVASVFHKRNGFGDRVVIRPETAEEVHGQGIQIPGVINCNDGFEDERDGVNYLVLPGHPAIHRDNDFEISISCRTDMRN